MKIETLLIDGHQVEAVQFGADHLIKGTVQDRLTIVWRTGYVGRPNVWGAESTLDNQDDLSPSDANILLTALDHFWPGWDERAS